MGKKAPPPRPPKQHSAAASAAVGPWLRQRYVFSGRLVLETALHVGGGVSLRAAGTDNPILRASNNEPVIPGSSFKGALRSTVERLIGAVRPDWTCALTSHQTCLTVAARDTQRDFEEKRRRWDDATLAGELETSLCATCRLFGSPYRASRLEVSDLHLVTPSTDGRVIRDGVAIDRDRGCAVPGLKFDYEVLERDAAFALHLTLENPMPSDLGLLSLGLAEAQQGAIPLGGLRSRGLGRCRLTELALFELDLTDPASALSRLQRYLLASSPDGQPGAGMTPRPDVQSFVARHIEDLLSMKGASAHA